MTCRKLIVAIAALAIVAVGPAHARQRHSARPNCVEQPAQFSVSRLLFGPAPRPNGCSPPVYAYGHFVGQDPDPNIRFQLKRDPSTGYIGDLMH